MKGNDEAREPPDSTESINGFSAESLAVVTADVQAREDRRASPKGPLRYDVGEEHWKVVIDKPLGRLRESRTDNLNTDASRVLNDFTGSSPDPAKFSKNCDLSPLAEIHSPSLGDRVPLSTNASDLSPRTDLPEQAEGQHIDGANRFRPDSVVGSYKGPGPRNRRKKRGGGLEVSGEGRRLWPWRLQWTSLTLENLRTAALHLSERSWVLLLLLGVLTSMMAFVIDLVSQRLWKWHTQLAESGDNWLSTFFLWMVFRVGMAFVALFVTTKVAPVGAGSGIPEMRSILDGFCLPEYLQPKVLVGKSLSLTAALASGLPIGKEGPFVHIACILAESLCRIKIFHGIQDSPDLFHHILSAACAVGVASTFGAPVGGVLFSVEVTSSYYMTSNYWRAFFCTVCCYVVFRLLREVTETEDENVIALFTTSFDPVPYTQWELPLFVLLSCGCGLFSGLFIAFFRAFVALRRKYQKQWFGQNPYVIGLVVTITTGLLEYVGGISAMLPSQEAIDDLFSHTALSSTENESLNAHDWDKPFVLFSIVYFTAVRFVSTAMVASLAIPAGIVTPVFSIGAGAGRFFGEIIAWIANDQAMAGGYAVVGAAAFTAGATGTLSIAVIIFELTGQLSYSIPVLLAVIIGKAVSMVLTKNIYDTIADDRGLPKWPVVYRQRHYSLRASHLMKTELGGVCMRIMTMDQLQMLLQDQGSAIFPVVDSARTMLYLGAVHRYYLQACLQKWEDLVTEANILASEEQTQGAGHSDSGSAHDFAHSTFPASMPTHSTKWKEHSVARGDRAVDLFSRPWITLDSVRYHVQIDDFASKVLLLFAVHREERVFVTQAGRLVGCIDAEDCYLD